MVMISKLMFKREFLWFVIIKVHFGCVVCVVLHV